MSEWKLIKLKFGRHPAHFGETGIGIEKTSERVRSDTLFSAWIAAYAKLLGREDVSELLENFNTQSAPPFRLSSTFLYQELSNHTVYYLPRPKTFPSRYPIGEDIEFAKDYKKLNYLSLEIWRKWYQGSEGFSQTDLQDKAIVAYKQAYKIEKFPKVAIDRTTRAANFYHTGFVQFNWTSNQEEIKALSGLYLLLNFPTSNLELVHNLKAALHFLGEEGIGGERSSGAGRFEVEWCDQLPKEWKSINLADFKAKHHALMSMFWTNDYAQFSDLGLTPENPSASYELLERGGWVSSPSSDRQARRKSVKMFTEGSVFSGIPQGKLADVTPDKFNNPRQGGHKVYRSGIALSLPIKTSDANS
ncbi:type III-A CRISPR-associated RAMP protein Csm4 [[Phormidium ambiguum] IAM M-71]|uniref:CRISPR system Cms protein Csm4 n=1 Tax=[Phormidium ambiguum] IAM M-71 TaxID=454136 RepID=A0A1U7IFF9_9CYAN|nr:type III-A CRISPR-associated RAMP protein Csm4 [Phormidium ambiguum]OKH35674.1 type III-A CRISPR-associated RAMP protein Csm4 [Phormidium ambiguum IAM M-71]